MTDPNSPQHPQIFEAYPPTYEHRPVPPKLPGPGDRRKDPADPGSRAGAIVAWITAVILVTITVLMNQAESLNPPAVAESTEITAPSVDPLTINAKMFVKISKVYTLSESDLKVVEGQLDAAAGRPEEVFRTAIAAGELSGTESAISRLDRAQSMNDEAENPSEELAGDIGAARAVFEDPDAPLTSEQEAGLRKRHGWFAEVLLTRKLEGSDPVRQSVVGGGGRLLAGIIAFVVLLGIAGLGSLAAVITGLVLLVNGKIRPAFSPPAQGGSVYLEMLPVFVGAFVLMHLASALAATFYGDNPPDWLLPVRLGVQWLLLGVTLYPLLRGVPWKEHCAAMGWHTGRGFWREVGAGIFGYLAIGLPLLVIAMVATLVVMLVRSAPGIAVDWPVRIMVAVGVAALCGLVAAGASLLSGRTTFRAASRRAAGFGAFIAACVAMAVLVLLNGDKGQPNNPIVELVEGASGWVLFLFAGMAVVWAPLAEESIFRGAFYRHLRSGAGLLLSAVVSAIVFGIMHGYEFVLLAGVISLGFTFALMREWRGSLIAPITAHALHNGTLMCLMVVVLKPLLE